MVMVGSCIKYTLNVCAYVFRILVYQLFVETTNATNSKAMQIFKCATK